MPEAASDNAPISPSRPRSPAALVAAGILLSRIAGLVRDRVFAHYFGNSDAADAFRAALRIPNFLQNLFGEGVLSASFIPVYARLLAEKRNEEAGKVAGAIAALLALVTSVLVLLGVLATPWLIGAIAPGFEGEKRALTIHLVRIFFPGAGLLVLSAWCLGVLNSHRRFFMSYAAPVLWNAAIIAAMVVFRRSGQSQLAIYAAWGSLAGSAAQVLLQLPLVLRLGRGIRFSWRWRSQGARTVARNFVPAFIGRGVVQISNYIDSIIASFLPTGAVAALAYAQTLYLMPISLFGMAVSAAELPAMSSALGEESEIAEQLRNRLSKALRQVAFFVVPSAAAFIAIGDSVVAAIYQTGRFTRDDTIFVWAVLAGYSVGLLPVTFARLYSSTLYALRDTRTPLRFALIRVAVSTALAYFAAMRLPGMLGMETRIGVVGLAIAAGLGGWLEYALLRNAVQKRIGKTGSASGYMLRVLVCAALASVAAYAARSALGGARHLMASLAVIAVFGAAYLLLAFAFGVPELRAQIQRLRA